MDNLFHPIIARWFASRFAQPTEPQTRGWPEIAAGKNTLIAAPTGSGKTLAAFLASIDRLTRLAIEDRLPDEIQVVYVSPLKALGNDIHRNLETPLAEIAEKGRELGYSLSPLRSMTRSGDTTAKDRRAMLRKPPHLLVTTPESLYLLLTAEKSREALRGVKTVIVDEIHALARDKRGSHMALSLERLEALLPSPPQRIGLSATQRPMDEIARFLVGANRVDSRGVPDCAIIDGGHLRQVDLAVEAPAEELDAVCSNEMWAAAHQRLADLILAHRATLVFVNTRRLAERVSRHLTEILGADKIASHHGSLSRESRFEAERRLQQGELRAIVATSSLELGIDVGFIDLVIQLGSPRSIAAFLQRVGRAGHSLGALPKGRLLALTRDELLECYALVRAAKGGRLDAIEIPRGPLDILAQQIVASVAAEEWNEDELYELCRRAWPYRDLSREDFDSIAKFTSEGIAPGARAGAHLHRDALGRRLRGRRGARLVAIASGGAIPETGDYRVVTEGDRSFVGTVNEDFAIESMAGDIFQLGNVSWRIRQVRGGEVVVSDAHSAPATIPFWLGEAPGRTSELSREVSDLRAELAKRGSAGADWLLAECGGVEGLARFASLYVAAQVAAIGLVPTLGEIVFERFFDESGGMQLVIHAPLGTRINRAWGLALRKCFCRSFDFELQASADDNGIVLSLGPQHSVPLEDMFRMLSVNTAKDLLIQALLAVPMFRVRWRWNVTRALAVARSMGGKRVPAPLQRFRAEDLLTAVFPAQTACQENVTGDIEVPDHPLIRQTVHDCLTEAMDIDGFSRLLARIASGEITLIPRDTREPSPFSHQLLNANPYAFLDPAPLEERRARAVATRRVLSADDADDLGQLDPAAIERVKAEAWPTVRDADELHDCLLSLGAIEENTAPDWRAWFERLLAAGRATVVTMADADSGVGSGASGLSGGRFWVAAENLPLAQAAYPGSTHEPRIELPSHLLRGWELEEAHAALVRGRIEVCGPTTARELAGWLGLTEGEVTMGLARLESEGAVLRGKFLPSRRSPSSTAGADGAAERGIANCDVEIEWCDRRLLSRIHRLTLADARKRIQPVSREDYWRYLTRLHGLAGSARPDGREGLSRTIARLQGFETLAGAWERDVLPSRFRDYDPAWLDALAQAGEWTWGRLRPPARDPAQVQTPIPLTRVVPMAIVRRQDLAWLLPDERPSLVESARGAARQALDALLEQGASFPQELLAATGLLPSELDTALGELAALGLATSDGLGPIRALSGDSAARFSRRGRSGRARARAGGTRRGGRWSRFPPRLAPVDKATRVERWAWQLLDRYGVVFRDLLARESVAPPWRDLASVYRRLEMQGKLRGGRFVANVGGEQFAQESTIEELRRCRDETSEGEASGEEIVIVSSTDPLNLLGVLDDRDRLPPSAKNRFALRGGKLLAVYRLSEVQFEEELDPVRKEDLTRRLRQSAWTRSQSTGAFEASLAAASAPLGGP